MTLIQVTEILCLKAITNATGCKAWNATSEIKDKIQSMGADMQGKTQGIKNFMYPKLGKIRNKFLGL